MKFPPLFPSSCFFNSFVIHAFSFLAVLSAACTTVLRSILHRRRGLVAGRRVFLSRVSLTFHCLFVLDYDSRYFIHRPRFSARVPLPFGHAIVVTPRPRPVDRTPSLYRFVPYLICD
jgi:hypothetical protein